MVSKVFHCSAPSKKAIACAISLRTTVRVQVINASKELQVQFPDEKFGLKPQIDFENLSLPISLQAILLIYKIIYSSENEPGLLIEVASEVPFGGGLGSSASFSTAVTGAIYGSKHGKIDLQEIERIVHQVESLFHGKPSGLDAYTVMNGGFVIAQNREFSKLSPQKLPLDLVIINTRMQRETKNLVNDVKEMREKRRQEFESIISQIGCVVDRSLSYLFESSAESNKLLWLSILKNQNLLSELGVSNSIIDDLCLSLYQHGYPTKITGAGGGGCLLVFCSQATKADLDTITEICKKCFESASIFKVSIDYQGLIFKIE